MKFIIPILVLLIIFSLYGCRSKKSTIKPLTDKTTAAVNTSKMINEGFQSGVIQMAKDDSKCPYTIDLEDENYNYLLDPINLEESFMQDGLKVWVKFSGMRMANRCEGALPVTIVEIQKREE